MAGPSTLAIRQIYGINSNVTDNLSFCDEDTVVYVAGHSVVLYNKLDKRQRFVRQEKEVVNTITAFALGNDRDKRYVAIAERGVHPQILIYDLRTFRVKKTLNASPDSLAKDFICMEFSTDDQFLLTLSSAPDWTIGVWSVSKAKCVASMQVSASPMAMLSRCSFNPLDTTMLCVSGRECMKFFRLTDRELRPLQETGSMTGHTIISHCWLKHPEDHLIAGTDAGQMLLFRSGEYLSTLGCLNTYLADPKNDTNQRLGDFPICSIVPLLFGFVVGTKNGTMLVIKYDDSVADGVLYDTQFAVVNKVVLGNDISTAPIVQMALSPSHENLCVLTGDNQLLSLDTLNVADTRVATPIKYLQCSFHGPKSIQGLDVCARKPLIITCCNDNTLRIWNYKTNEIEILKVFLEDMYCATLHPTGLHCAVGFSDKLRVYHILVDEIRVCLEVPIKNCRECKFSKGGHMLAVVSGNNINVLDFYTGEKVADLRGHIGKVKSIHWLDSGNQLLSCGIDGAVYLWNIENGSRLGEFVQKGTTYTSAVVAGGQAFAVGSDKSDRNLYILDMPELSNLKYFPSGALLGNVQVSVQKGSVFATITDPGKPGAIKTYPYPCTGDYITGADTICMSSQITRCVLTPDETFLVAADESGCIVVMELKDKLDRYQRNMTGPAELTVLETWTDEVLVGKVELEERNSAIGDLKQKVDELKMHNEYQLKLKDMNYSEKIKEVTDKFVQELEQAKTKYELLIEESADSKMEYDEKVRQMGEKHQHDLQEIETRFQAQIMEQVERHQQLLHEKEAHLTRLESQRRDLLLSHERYVEELTVDCEKKLEEDRHDRLQAEQERGLLSREMEEAASQLEDDVDAEIQLLRRKFEEKLNTARETTLKYKGENGIMKKKKAVLEKEFDDHKEELVLAIRKEHELHEQIKVLEREVSAGKKEIKLRDQSIGERERKIYELKKKNQELDKFKFVLDFKIRELKEQVEPRQNEIESMRDQIKEKDEELDKYHTLNSSLDDMIGSLRARIDELQKVRKRITTKAKMEENAIAAFKGDIQAAVAHILSPPALKQAVEKLIMLHGSSGPMKPRIDPDVDQEYTRHKEVRLFDGWLVWLVGLLVGLLVDEKRMFSHLVLFIVFMLNQLFYVTLLYYSSCHDLLTP